MQMEALRNCEGSVTIYLWTRSNISEDLNVNAKKNRNFTITTQCVVMCFVCSSEQMAIISGHGVNRLGLVIVTKWFVRSVVRVGYVRCRKLVLSRAR